MPTGVAIADAHDMGSRDLQQMVTMQFVAQTRRLPSHRADCRRQNATGLTAGRSRRRIASPSDALLGDALCLMHCCVMQHSSARARWKRAKKPTSRAGAWHCHVFDASVFDASVRGVSLPGGLVAQRLQVDPTRNVIETLQRSATGNMERHLVIPEDQGTQRRITKASNRVGAADGTRQTSERVDAV